MPSAYKYRQLRPESDAARLAELGREMAAKGHVALRAEKDRLSVDSLAFLQDFQHLEAIAVYGVAKGIEVIAQLRELREVILSSMALRDLSFLESLPRLDTLWLKGLQLKFWSSVGSLKNVKSLDISNTRLDDFSFLSEMTGLQIVRFRSCSRLAALPDLSKLTQLRRVVFDTTNRLSDLSGLAKAPNLEDVIVSIAKELPTQGFDCLLSHPTIKSIYPALDLLDSPRHKAAVARIPPHLLLGAWFGTPHEQFVLR